MPQSYSPVYFPSDWSGVSLSAANKVLDSCSDNSASNIGNYSTLNPLDHINSSGSTTFSNGNRSFLPSTTSIHVYWTTIPLSTNNTTKYYAELETPSGNDIGWMITNQAYVHNSSSTRNVADAWYCGLEDTNTFRANEEASGNIDATLSETYVYSTDRIGLAVDPANGKVWVGHVDSSASSIEWKGPSTSMNGDPANGNNATLTPDTQNGTHLQIAIFNSNGGSRTCTIHMEPSSWVGTPPTGFNNAIYTANLPAPTVTNPDDNFTIKTLVNSGTPNTSFDTGLSSVGLIMAKRTDGNGGWEWFDIARGANALLQSDNNDDEGTKSGFSFSGGTFNFDNTANLGQASTSHVVYSWIAGGSPSSNGNGSITSSVSAASHGGFSVGTYTGAGGTQTIGHGLSRTPSWVIVKMRSGSGTQTWTTYVDSLAESLGSNQYIILSLNDGPTNGAAFNSTAPAATVFTVGANDATNGSSNTYCFWAFAKTPGLIGSGIYSGNSSSDGPVIQVDDGGSGFKPAWLMIKRLGTEFWGVFDNVGDPSNPVNKYLNMNTNLARNAGTGGNDLDFTANGFKLRSTNAATNTGSDYIYLAMAEDPFGGIGVAQARAR